MGENKQGMQDQIEALRKLAKNAQIKKGLKKIEAGRYDLLTDKEIRLIEGQSVETKTDAERMKAQRKRDSMLIRRPCKDIKRRTKLEKSPEKWLKHYLPSLFPKPFGQVHKDIIKSAVKTIKFGTGTVACCPRGCGKTSVLRGLCLWAVCCGHSRFPVVVGWRDKEAKETLRVWLSALSDVGSPLCEDYGHLTQPFEMSIHSMRLTALHWKDGDNCGAGYRASSGTIILPDSHGAFAAISINSSSRGMSAQLADGSVQRPDTLLLDDCQSRQVAASPTLTAQTLATISGDLLSLAGPDSRISCLVACTVIEPDDVSERLLDNPEYDAIRVPQIITWPIGWHNLDSECRILWESWNEVRLADKSGVQARKFYKEHKEVLTDGMTVSWKHRKDVKRKDPDALYNAIYDFYRLGAASFDAERQGKPQRPETTTFVLTPKQVLTHTAMMIPRYQLPVSFTTLTASADVNRSGLHWSVCGYDQDYTAHVVAYGKWPERGSLWPENAPELVRKRAIFAGFAGLCEHISSLPINRDGKLVHPSLMLLDRGYEPEVVHAFVAQAAYPMRLGASRGYAAHKYYIKKSTLVGAPREQCHIVSSRLGQFASHNADYWREVTQKAWLGESGAAGSATLFGPDPHFHQPFAEQLCAERLKNKYITDAGMRYEWVDVPTVHNDWLDALVMCYVAAAINGLNTGGSETIAQQRPQQKAQGRRPRSKIGSTRIR